MHMMNLLFNVSEQLQIYVLTTVQRFWKFIIETNRDSLIDHPEAINSLVISLSSENADLVYPACGAVLNTSMDNESVQLELVNREAMIQLTKIVKQSVRTNEFPENTCGMAIRAISNLVETGILEVLT